MASSEAMTTYTPTQDLSKNTIEDVNTDSNYNNYYNEDGGYIYEEYMYPIYSFEKPVYFYIWEILVIFMFLVNLIVISALLRRRMRNSTHVILVAIAISDSLTGLVTLPTYIMVSQTDQLLPEYDHNEQMNFQNLSCNELEYDCNPSTVDILSINFTNGNVHGSVYTNGEDVTTHHEILGENKSNSFYNQSSVENQDWYHIAAEEGLPLSEILCEWFMISKYFLSKSFHTVSIFLTLFLAIQRYISVAFPFRSQSIFTTRRIIVCCVVIFIVSPALHSYHVSKEKAVAGNCVWEFGEGGCKEDCVYLWVLFFTRHFIPCSLLTTFTTLFIKHLQSGTATLRKMDAIASQVLQRREENRRISLVVIAVVVVFLVPEIPYGAFLCYSAIDKTLFDGASINLKNNRAIHMAYELSLLLSFHANFYIYTFLNKRFRTCLYKTFIKPALRIVSRTRKFSVSAATSSASRKTRRTGFVCARGDMEMKTITKSATEISATDTKAKQLISNEF